MSEAAEKKIAELERELKVAEELLALILHQQDGEVIFDLEEARTKLREGGDRIVDMEFDYDGGTLTVRLLHVHEQ